MKIKILAFLFVFSFLLIGCGGGSDSGGSGSSSKPLLTANIPAGAKGIFRASVQSSSAYSTDGVQSLMADEDSMTNGALYAMMSDGSVKEITFNTDNITAYFSDFRNVGGGYMAVQYYQDYRTVVALINGNTGKIYDLKVNDSYYGYAGINSVIVMGHYAYFTAGSGGYSTAYKIDLTDMTFIAYNDPNYDRLDCNLIFFRTGDLLCGGFSDRSKVFPASSAILPYYLILDKLSYSNAVIPLTHSFTDRIIVSGFLTWEDWILTWEDWFDRGRWNYLRNYLTTRDIDGEFYSVNLMHIYDTPVEYQSGVYNNATCKVDSDNNPFDCYTYHPFLALNRYYIDNKVLKRETTAKIPLSSDSYGDYRGNMVVPHTVSNSNTQSYDTANAYIQIIFDDDSFYQIDMKAIPPSITETAWKLGRAMTNVDIKNTVYYAQNGIAWMGKDESSIYYIPYKENALPVKVVDRPVAGKISLSGDSLIYTERFTSTSFKTYSLNLVTNEKKALSSSQLDTGVIFELGM